MKSIPDALEAHYDTGSTTLAYALRITRTDEEVFGFTSADTSETIDDVLYDASQGLDVSSIATTAGLGVDNLELSTLDDGTLFDRAEVLGNVWQNADFLIFRYNWATPANGVEYLMAGTIGQVRLLRGSIVLELRGLQQYLQQPVGAVTSKTCRARFADFPTQAGNARCGLSAAAWTDGLRVTSVSSRRLFSAAVSTGVSRADAWFDEGVLTWQTGANAGLQARIKSYGHSPAEFELYRDMPHAIAVGDYLRALAGCRKRLSEDCLTRFNNVLNFQGEPHMPGIDEVTSPPVVQA